MIKRVMPRYRPRTWLRGRLPEPLPRLFPKGAGDCRAHEWHRADEQTWLCLHCRVGVSHTNPWSPIETAARDMLAVEALASASRYRPLREEELEWITRLLGEAQDALRAVADRPAAEVAAVASNDRIATTAPI